ncbi:hypothetical protein D3C80_1075960 [compost metagenome]
MQALAIRQAEEAGSQTLQLTGAQGFATAALFVTAIEQPIDVLLDETLALANRFRVAEQEQNTCARLQVAAGNVVQQAIEQFDRRCFVAMDPRRQQQVQAIVTRFRWPDFQRTFAQPAHAHAFDSQLSLLRRFAAGEGQFKQFAEGEHRAVSLVVVVAIRAVNVILVVAEFSRFHLQLQTYQISRQWAQQQVGVFGIAFFDVHADQQLATAVLLDPQLFTLPQDRDAGAGRFQLRAVGVFKDQLQGIAHVFTLSFEMNQRAAVESGAPSIN